jgi:hypothetical protein
MVVLLVCYFLTLIWVWKMRIQLVQGFRKASEKASADIAKANGQIAELTDQLKISALKKKALKKKAKAKAKALEDLLESKEQVILVLQEQLKITQHDDRELRETNLRLGNQLAEAHSTISHMRENW